MRRLGIVTTTKRLTPLSYTQYQHHYIHGIPGISFCNNFPPTSDKCIHNKRFHSAPLVKVTQRHLGTNPQSTTTRIPARVTVTRKLTPQNRFSSTKQESTQQQAEGSVVHSPTLLITPTLHCLDMIPVGKMSHDDCVKASSLIYRWSDFKTLEAGQWAEKLLERLFTERRDGFNRSVHLSVSAYQAILDCYAKCGMEDGPFYAQRLIERMAQRYVDMKQLHTSASSSPTSSELVDFYITPRPDTVCYNCVLHAWSKSSHEQAVPMSESIVGFLESPDNISSASPNTATYNILMNAYANQVGRYGFAQKAEDVLLKMSNLSRDGHVAVSPDTASFNTVLKAWKNSKEGIESAQRAEDILRLMMKLDSDGHSNVKPDKISFSTVIYAYGNNRREEGIDNVTKAIDGAFRVLDLFFQSNAASIPNAAMKCFHAVIDIIINSFDTFPEVGYKIILLLDKMNNAKKQGIISDQPSGMSYFSILERLKISRDASLHKTQISANIMRAILQKMIDGTHGVVPNTFCFNKLLHVYCRALHEKEAEALYREMKDLASSRKYPTVPDEATFSMMVDLYYQSQSYDSASKALSILQDMDTTPSTSTNGPTIFCYNIVISKLCKSNIPENVESAYDLLVKISNDTSGINQSHQSDNIHYNMVISALARGGVRDPSTKALNLLRFMRKSRDDGKSILKPDLFSYTHVFQTWARYGRGVHSDEIMEIFDEINRLDRSNSVVLLDTVVFESILHGLSLGKNRKDSANAKRVFERMLELHNHGHDKVTLSVMVCNMLLKAIVSNAKMVPGAVSEGHDTLISMVKRYKQRELPVLPDRVGFNTILNAWSKSRHPDALEKAETLLNLMKTLDDEDSQRNLSPDSFTYASMIAVISNSNRCDAGERSDELFTRIDPVHTDCYVYNRLLCAWAKSSSDIKLERVLNILQTIAKQGKADIVSYNTALNAFAYFSGDAMEKENAWVTVKDIYGTICSSYDPDEVTYTTMIRAAVNLCSNQSLREEFIRDLFADCCRRGLAGQPAIRALRSAISDPERRRIVLGYTLEEKMNQGWGRNGGDAFSKTKIYHSDKVNR